MHAKLVAHKSAAKMSMSAKYIESQSSGKRRVTRSRFSEEVYKYEGLSSAGNS